MSLITQKMNEYVASVQDRLVKMGRPVIAEMFPATYLNTIETKLIVSEMMGSEVHLHVRTNDGIDLIVRVPTIQLSPEQRANLHAGATLYITFEDKVMYFFDPETQDNLLYK